MCYYHDFHPTKDRGYAFAIVRLARAARSHKLSQNLTYSKKLYEKSKYTKKCVVMAAINPHILFDQLKFFPFEIENLYLMKK